MKEFPINEHIICCTKCQECTSAERPHLNSCFVESEVSRLDYATQLITATLSFSLCFRMTNILMYYAMRCHSSKAAVRARNQLQLVVHHHKFIKQEQWRESVIICLIAILWLKLCGTQQHRQHSQREAWSSWRLHLCIFIKSSENHVSA